MKVRSTILLFCTLFLCILFKGRGQSVLDNKDLIQLPKITKIPFGCANIKKFRIDFLYLDDDTILTSKINRIQDCYNEINFPKNKKMLTGLKLSDTPELLMVDIYNKKDFEKGLLNFTENVRYRLPDMGPYRVFYASRFSAPHNEKYEFRFGEAGNLILVDSVTNKVKLLNIYLSLSRPDYSFTRYFYISPNQSIELFDTEGGDDFFKVKVKYYIQILPDGEIIIKEVKK